MKGGSKSDQRIDQWFYNDINGDEQGPYSTEKIRAWFNRDQIHGDSIIFVKQGDSRVNYTVKKAIGADEEAEKAETAREAAKAETATEAATEAAKEAAVREAAEDGAVREAAERMAAMQAEAEAEAKEAAAKGRGTTRENFANIAADMGRSDKAETGAGKATRPLRVYYYPEDVTKGGVSTTVDEIKVLLREGIINKKTKVWIEGQWDKERQPVLRPLDECYSKLGIPADFPQGKDKSWGIMDKTELQSAITLGWSKKSWDAGERDQLMRHWELMKSREKDAAINLGFKETDFVVPEGKEPYTPQVPVKWVPSMGENEVLYFTNIHNGNKIEQALIDNMEIVGTDWEQTDWEQYVDKDSLWYSNATTGKFNIPRGAMLYEDSDILVLADNMMNTRAEIIADKKKYTSLIDYAIHLQEEKARLKEMESQKARLKEMESQSHEVGSGDTDTQDESLAWLVEPEDEYVILKENILRLETSIDRLRKYFNIKGFADGVINATIKAAVENKRQQEALAKSVQESKRAEHKAAKAERKAAEEAKREAAEEAKRKAAKAEREAAEEAEREAAEEAERKAAEEAKRKAEMQAEMEAREAEREAAIEDEDLLGTEIYYYSKSTEQNVRAEVTGINEEGTNFEISYEVAGKGGTKRRLKWITKSELIQAKEAEALLGTEIYYYSESTGQNVRATVTKYRIDTEGTKFLILYEVATRGRTFDERKKWITKSELIQAKEAEDLMGTEIYYNSKSGQKIPAEVTKYRIDTEGTKFLISYKVAGKGGTSNKRLKEQFKWITESELESAMRPGR